MTRKWDPAIGQFRDSGRFGGNDNAAAAGGMSALGSPRPIHQAGESVDPHPRLASLGAVPLTTTVTPPDRELNNDELQLVELVARTQFLGSVRVAFQRSSGADEAPHIFMDATMKGRTFRIRKRTEDEVEITDVRSGAGFTKKRVGRWPLRLELSEVQHLKGEAEVASANNFARDATVAEFPDLARDPSTTATFDDYNERVQMTFARGSKKVTVGAGFMIPVPGEDSQGGELRVRVTTTNNDIAQPADLSVVHKESNKAEAFVRRYMHEFMVGLGKENSRFDYSGAYDD